MRIFVPKNLKISKKFIKNNIHRDCFYYAFNHGSMTMLHKVRWGMPNREIITIFADNIGVMGMEIGCLNLKQYRELQS